MEKDNEKLSNALHKLKLALIPLAQERPVLQILRKMTQNEDLQVQDIHQDNVLQLFLRLLPSSTVSSIISTAPITSLPSSNAIVSMSSNINIPTLPTIRSSFYERCQKCSKIGGHLVSCMNCHIVQHVACCSKGERPSIETMNIQWLCINCKYASSKRKNHYTDKNIDVKAASSNLLSGYKRIKVCNQIKENGNKPKNSSPLHSINTQSPGSDSEGVLSPRLTSHKMETNERNALNMGVKVNQKQDSTDLVLPHTPMSGDNESDGASKGSEMEIDIGSNQDEPRLGSLDRVPPPDNSTLEVTRQPARFDGDM